MSQHLRRHRCPAHSLPSMSRREILLRGGAAFGALPLAFLEQQSAAAAVSPHAARPGHHGASAKSVIFLFMEGGPSHIDLFDRKPAINKLAGQPLPASFERVITAMGELESPVLAAPRTWKQHGESGLWVSEWLPHTAQCIDDIAVIRSCWTNGINHAGGVCQMNTCLPLAGRPALGAWVSYGLGTENEDLPAFVVMQDHPGQVVNGPRNWGTAFMPAVYQGTEIQPRDVPIQNLNRPPQVTAAQQLKRLRYLNQLNQRHAEQRMAQSELEARIASYELAFRMQTAAPEAVDLAQETTHTKTLYGLDDKKTETFGRMCLLARRLVERGVRFIQLYHGAGSKWDAHKGIEKNHAEMCAQSDRPVA
ncbi:MAG: DUF1501 domain-containing protein, partial [Planctomycetales bacterium]|nr:DUF1501 domain-containing protein [Planctomycetales bacterium]